MTSSSAQKEKKVGFFLLGGTLLLALAILSIGKSDYLFQKKIIYFAFFQNVNGLIAGAKVILEGVPVGIVDQISLEPKTRKIKITLAVSQEAKEWIRQGSTVEMGTLGVLGDKYLALKTGNSDKPALPMFSEIPVSPSPDLSYFLSKGDRLLAQVNDFLSRATDTLNQFQQKKRSERFFQSTTQSVEDLAVILQRLKKELPLQSWVASSEELQDILSKINQGTGTLGKLVNDPDLYDQVSALMGGANRNRVLRNLVRKTLQDASTVKEP